jgi:hypothetical protein
VGSYITRGMYHVLQSVTHQLYDVTYCILPCTILHSGDYLFYINCKTRECCTYPCSIAIYTCTHTPFLTDRVRVRIYINENNRNYALDTVYRIVCNAYRTYDILPYVRFVVCVLCESPTPFRTVLVCGVT